MLKIYNGERVVSSTNDVKKKWTATCKKQERNWTTIYTTNKSQLKKNYRLKIRSETIKLLQKNIEGKLYGVALGRDFLDMTPKAQEKNRYMGLHQTKEFLYDKGKNRLKW